MYKIEIERKYEIAKVKKQNKDRETFSYEPSTLGDLNIYDENGMKVFWCKTLENGGPSTDTPNQDKRIVAREYKLATRPTGVTLPKDCNKIGIWLQDPNNPKFADRFIMIHVGNYPQDTEGCILLGEAYNTMLGTISSSTSACSRFYDFVKEKGGVGNFILNIKEYSGKNPL